MATVVVKKIANYVTLYLRNTGLYLAVMQCYNETSTGQVDPRVGSGRKFYKFIFCLLEILSPYSDLNLSVHNACFVCMSYLQDCTFRNLNLITRKILTLYFENSTFDVIMSCSCRSGSVFSSWSAGRVGSQKNDPWDISVLYAAGLDSGERYNLPRGGTLKYFIQSDSTSCAVPDFQWFGLTVESLFAGENLRG